jgi:mannosyltransferase OCH1-like enzyme
MRWISKLILFAPLTLLLIENILVGFYWMCTISVQEFPAPPSFTPQRLTLAELTTNSNKDDSCQSPLLHIDNQQISLPRKALSKNRIPHIIHQTSKSRCVTPRLAKAIQTWQTWTDWEYYFHNDEAVARLFQQSAQQDFPLLGDLYPHCLVHGTLRADLWRYLILWEYGGLYADVDAVPVSFTPDWLEESDAFFVVEQYHLLSQYFIAVTPKHPLMWYAIQVSLSNLWKLTDTGGVAAAITTGPHALHQAFILFAKDGGLTIEPARPGEKPVKAGTYVGTQGRSLTVVGVAERQNEIIDRDVLGSFKKLEYSRLNMTFHQDDKKKVLGKACFAAIRESKFGK